MTLYTEKELFNKVNHLVKHFKNDGYQTVKYFSSTHEKLYKPNELKHKQMFYKYFSDGDKLYTSVLAFKTKDKYIIYIGIYLNSICKDLIKLEYFHSYNDVYSNSEIEAEEAAYNYYKNSVQEYGDSLEENVDYNPRFAKLTDYIKYCVDYENDFSDYSKDDDDNELAYIYAYSLI